MKKILVVDDNPTNRMLLQALLDDYSKANSLGIFVVEAVNGVDAVKLAKTEHFDLIFMDIMMPIMDGIEATRRIRASDSKVMIIAVSAADDTQHQKEILENGAEDYISKPIDTNIFNARLGNYLTLIDSRNGTQKRFNPNPANLFSQETYSRKLLFYIRNDGELAEFWEYYLLDHDGRSGLLSATIRTLCAIGSVGVKLKIPIQVIIEESDDYLYMTMVGIEGIRPKIIQLLLIKNSDVTDYKLSDQKISIRIPRVQKVPTPVDIPLETTPSLAVATLPVEDTPLPVETQDVVLHIYDYMDVEDLEDLREHIGKLNSLMMVVGREIDASEVGEIGQNLQKISRIAIGYTDSYPIGSALASIGSSISMHTDLFIEKSKDIAPMCAAFGRDLNNWIRLIFSEGATSVHYMDDTIIANAQMIESILTMDDHPESGDENLDNIFDF